MSLCTCLTHTECITTLCHGMYDGPGHPHYTEAEERRYTSPPFTPEPKTEYPNEPI